VLLVAPALAAEVLRGERLEWSVQWLGMEAGRVVAQVSGTTERATLEITSWSTGLAAALHPVDDFIRSTWVPGLGSVRYETRFREGRFAQDQDIALGPERIVARRHELRGGAWRDVEDSYPYEAGAEDPISSLWRLRAGDPARDATFACFTGRKTHGILVRALGHDEQGWRLEVGAAADRARHGVFYVWIDDSPSRLPVRAEFPTRAGTVSLVLTSSLQAPPGFPGAARELSRGAVP
jgi:hypothetical protein